MECSLPGHSADTATAQPAWRELNRVGTAAAMMVIAGTMIIIAMTMMLGHYNSLAHCGPKAVLDGATLTLLLGNRGRFRVLALLGVVYGLVLVVQVGVVYLLVVMAVAGLVAAGVGWLAAHLNRAAALCLAAVCFELLAGCGAPIKILLATRHADEPVLWMMWFAEWPLRIAGAVTGVWLARRWVRRQEWVPAPLVRVPATESSVGRRQRGTAVGRVPGRGQAALRLAAAIIACFVPMLLDGWLALGLAAAVYLLYGWWAGLRRHVFSVVAALLWGWLVFAAASFIWHHDRGRAVDLVRSFVLGMCPLAVSAPALILTTRAVDLVRVLRWWRVPAPVLIPVAHIARQVPLARARFAADVAGLRAQGVWTGPWSVLRKPGPIVRGLLGPQLQGWMTALTEEPTHHGGTVPHES